MAFDKVPSIYAQLVKFLMAIQVTYFLCITSKGPEFFQNTSFWSKFGQLKEVSMPLKAALAPFVNTFTREVSLVVYFEVFAEKDQMNGLLHTSQWNSTWNSNSETFPSPGNSVCKLCLSLDDILWGLGEHNRQSVVSFYDNEFGHKIIYVPLEFTLASNLFKLDDTQHNLVQKYVKKIWENAYPHIQNAKRREFS